MARILTVRLTVRLSPDVAEYLVQTAANSRLSVNKTIESILRAARDNGWTEVSMVPAVRKPDNE